MENPARGYLGSQKAHGSPVKATDGEITREAQIRGALFQHLKFMLNRSNIEVICGRPQTGWKFARKTSTMLHAI